MRETVDNIRQEEAKAAMRVQRNAAERADERRPGRVIDRLLHNKLQALRAWPSGDRCSILILHHAHLRFTVGIG